MAELDAAEEGDDDLRAIVLTGAGERAFSAGADIACFPPSVRRGQAAALREFVRRGQQMARIESFPKPIIAAVNGFAHGGGCEIASRRRRSRSPASACAILQGRDQPRLPASASCSRCARLIGRKRALRMILTADPIDAAAAHAAGLVNDVVPRARS